MTFYAAIESYLLKSSQKWHDLVQVLAARHASACDVLPWLVAGPENAWQHSCAACSPLWVLQV